MLRATITTEKAGFPTVPLVGSVFVQQARIVSKMFGVEDLPLAVYPGRIPMDDEETFREKVTTTVADQIVEALMKGAPRLVDLETEPAPRDVVFSGDLRQVNDFFQANLWSDGLPVVPPTIEVVEDFLSFTDRDRDEVLGLLQPEFREATVWSVGVNGAMAGCRPEYMPVLLAVVEAVVDPRFRAVDLASGSAWEPIITVSGPIIEQLGFNYSTGAQRVGWQANTSIGRFLNLFLRNVAGLRPGLTEKGGLGQTFFVVLAEDEAVVREIGWSTLGEDDGVPAGESGVTVAGVFSASTPLGEYEDGGRSGDPYTYLRPLVEYFGKGTAEYWTWASLGYEGSYPLVVLSQHCARVLAADGWTKDSIRRYLFEEARVPARRTLARGPYVGIDEDAIADRIRAGTVHPDFQRSRDPDRLIPVFIQPETTRIIVAGNPDMYWQRGYVPTHVFGTPTTKTIRLRVP